MSDFNNKTANVFIDTRDVIDIKRSHFNEVRNK
jgi:hypothetical protein